MRLMNLITSPVYLSERCFPCFLIAADKSRHKETNTRRLCLCAGMWMSHMHTSMCNDKMCVCVCVCVCVSAPASLGGNICCRVSEATCLTPSCSRWPAGRPAELIQCLLKQQQEDQCAEKQLSLLDRPTARHLRQSGWKPGVSNVEATGNLLCMLEVTDWRRDWNGLKLTGTWSQSPASRLLQRRVAERKSK